MLNKFKLLHRLDSLLLILDSQFKPTYIFNN